jgi:hypothetical protein
MTDTGLSGGKNEYILIFPGEKLVYTHFSGGTNEYVTPASAPSKS